MPVPEPEPQVVSEEELIPEIDEQQPEILSEPQAENEEETNPETVTDPPIKIEKEDDCAMPEKEEAKFVSESEEIKVEKEDDCAIPDIDDSMKAAFSKIDEVENQEIQIDREFPVLPEPDENSDNKDEETFGTILENTDQNTSVEEIPEEETNDPPVDLSTDKPFYYGTYEKNFGEGVGWSNEMTMFYMKSWGGEKFTVEGCQSNMHRKLSSSTYF